VTDDHKRLTALLIGDFVALRAAAGGPSLIEIERESRRLEGTPVRGVRVTRLPRSTVHDLLRRVRSRPLRPELVESLWAVLHHLAAATGRRPERLVTLAELRQRLQTINVLWDVREVPRPASAGGGGGPAAVFDPFGCPPVDGDETTNRRWLLESAGEAQAQAWWQGGRHLVPDWLATYLTLERRAESVRTYAPWFVPGLLQTEEYAWAAFRQARPNATAAELAGLVHLRMRRQEPLWRRDALRVWAVIDEAALSARICGAGAMRTQLDHLLQVCALPQITVQVMPRDAGGHNAADGPISLLRFPEHLFPDVAFVEQRDYGLYPSEEDDVSHYRQLHARLAIEALTPDESADLLWKVRVGL
jgi:hypothetical protein